MASTTAQRMSSLSTLHRSDVPLSTELTPTHQRSSITLVSVSQFRPKRWHTTRKFLPQPGCLRQFYTTLPDDPPATLLPPNRNRLNQRCGFSVSALPEFHNSTPSQATPRVSLPYSSITLSALSILKNRHVFGNRRPNDRPCAPPTNANDSIWTMASCVH